MSSFDRASWLRRRPRIGRLFALAATAGAALALTPAFAQQDVASPPAVQGDEGGQASRAPLAPDPAFARYPQYRGTLGGRRIVLRIGVKPDDPQGLNGEYAFLAAGPDAGAGVATAHPGPVILIAGARDGDTLTLEESDDGVRISGQWVGVYAADGGLSGERMNNDESVSTPFDLRPETGAARADAPGGADDGHSTDTQSGQGRARPATSQGRP
ncbi:MAG: hypothetical protein ACRYGL_08125 [Janthinobacterium lividum]